MILIPGHLYELTERPGSGSENILLYTKKKDISFNNAVWHRINKKEIIVVLVQYDYIQLEFHKVLYLNTLFYANPRFHQFKLIQ